MKLRVNRYALAVSGGIAGLPFGAFVATSAEGQLWAAYYFIQPPRSFTWDTAETLLLGGSLLFGGSIGAAAGYVLGKHFTPGAPK